MAKVAATGSSIVYNSLTIGALKSIGEVSPTGSEIDMTTLDSSGGYKEFAQGFKDGGEVTLTGIHSTSDTGQAGVRTNFGTGDVDACVITFPDSTTVSFNAWVKSYSIGAAEVDGAVGFKAVLRITGAVTVA